MHSDIRRILDLPRYSEDFPSDDDLVEALTEELRTPNGTMRLLPAQARALYVAAIADALVGVMPVGCGKTLTGALLPSVLGAERPLYLTRASLTGQLQSNFSELSEHWEGIPAQPTIWSFHYLSQRSREAEAALSRMQPDVLIIDEAHAIAGDSGRASIIEDYVLEYEPRMAIMSGTLTRKSLNDFANLVYLVLGVDAPVPIDGQVRHALAAVVDAEPRRSIEPEDWAFASQLRNEKARASRWGNDENAVTRTRRAFQERFAATPGVMVIDVDDLPHGLDIYLVDNEVPGVVAGAIDELKDTWIKPSGEMLVMATEVAATERNLSTGFFYEQVWEDGEEDVEWTERRKAWARLIRHKLKRRREGMRTPSDVIAWAESKRTMPRQYTEWLEVADRPGPTTTARWLSIEPLKDAIDWIGDSGIIWYSSRAAGDMLEALGIQTFRSGDDISEHKEDVIAASTGSFGTGTDGLQLRYNRMYFLEPLPAGADFEQVVGRLDRQGQPRDVVEVGIPISNARLYRDFKKVQNDAQYIYEKLGTRQRIHRATIIEPEKPEEEDED